MTASNPPRRWTFDNIALSLIAVSLLPAGLQAASTTSSVDDRAPTTSGWRRTGTGRCDERRSGDWTERRR